MDINPWLNTALYLYGDPLQHLFKALVQFVPLFASDVSNKEIWRKKNEAMVVIS